MNDHDLDRYLQSYAAPAEPPAGLEQRVLAHVRRDRWQRRGPIIALAAAAALALVFAPQPAARPPLAPPPLIAASIPPVPLVKTVVSRRATPSPVRRATLTPEERQLWTLVHHHAQLASEVLIEGPKRHHELIDVKPIVIEPLSIGEPPQ